MSSTNLKRVIFEELAKVAKAVAHPLRLEILEQLAQGERSVEVLADRTHLSVANASQHLQNMRRAGVVTARRQGKFVFYRLADDAVLGLLASLRTVAERCSAELERIVRRYFSDKDGLEAVSRAELMKRLRAGTARVIDVRPEDEFALGHLPGAISVPLREIERRLCDLDPEGEIVAYCRGPYCVLAYEAVAWLRARGFNARRLEDGLPEWRAAGFPVEEGHPLPSAPSV